MELSSEGFCLFLVKQLLLLCRMTGCSSLREVSVRLDCLPYKSFPPLFSPKQVSDNSTDLTRLFFEQESYCHQCVRFCCYLFWVIIRSSAWQLFMKYKYLKSWGHAEYHWHHGWAIHVSKSFWTEEQELIKTTDFHFSLTIDQITYFVEYFT